MVRKVNKTMRFLILYLLLASFLSGCMSYTQKLLKIIQSEKPERRIALVIGNGNYQDGITKLEGSLKDAEEIAKAKTSWRSYWCLFQTN